MSAFVDQHRDRFGVEPICREIEASASAYRARRTRPPSARAVRDDYLLGEIKRVHAGSGGIYGQLKIWDELNDEGISVARWSWSCPVPVDTWKLGRGSLKLSLLQSPLELRR